MLLLYLITSGSAIAWRKRASSSSILRWGAIVIRFGILYLMGVVFLLIISWSIDRTWYYILFWNLVALHFLGYIRFYLGLILYLMELLLSIWFLSLLIGFSWCIRRCLLRRFLQISTVFWILLVLIRIRFCRRCFLNLFLDIVVCLRGASHFCECVTKELKWKS